MKKLQHFSYTGFRPLFLTGGLLLLVFLQGCSTYSASSGYPRGHSYQTQVSGYSGDRYYGHRYYGSYQPGWFIHAGFPGHYDPWGYAPLAYWPSYSHAYYRHAYYPYYDPWYYSFSSHYRNSYYRQPYGYGYGYRYGNPYGNHYGSRYGQYPYYGNTHSYRPPGQTQPTTGSRPDPVVIPRSERGRRGASGEFDQRVDEGSRQRETHQPGRRAATVVDQEQNMSRSVGVAPAQASDQGMTISSRSERKVRESRLEPVGAENMNAQPNVANEAQNNQRGYSTRPVQRSAPDIQVNSGRSTRGYQPPTEALRPAPASRIPGASSEIVAPVAVPQMRSEQHGYRQAPARAQPSSPQPNQQPPAPRNAPNHQQRPDSGNGAPRADRRQQRDIQSERERQNR